MLDQEDKINKLKNVEISFTKDFNSGQIEIFTNEKYREFCFYDIKDFSEFVRKVDNKSNLWYRQYFSFSGTKGMTARLYSKRVHRKNKIPYDIQGKYCNFYYDSRGTSILEEIKITRNDSFFLPEYKELNKKLFSFIENKEFYEKNNLFYRLGLLLYGFPGNGKTSWLRYLLNNKLLPESATVIWCKDLPSGNFIQAFKQLKGLKIFIFEEITSMTQNSTDIREFLQFMDGEQTLDNSVYIATTNHPEQLPQNVVERPGRFDIIFEMDNPNTETRTVILKEYFKENFNGQMVQDSDGLSHAEIKEAFISSVLNQITFKEAVKKARDHKDFVRNGFEKFRKIGF